MPYVFAILILLASSAAYANPPVSIRAPATRVVQQAAFDEPGPSDVPRRTVTQEPDTEVTIPGQRQVIETPDTTVRVPGQRTVIDELPPRRITKQATIIEELPARVVTRRAAPVFVDEYFVDTFFAPVCASPVFVSPRRGFFGGRSTYRSRTVVRGGGASIGVGAYGIWW